MKDNKEEMNTEITVYEPKIKEKKASFVWVVPLIILMILGWVVYDSYSKKGTNIVVSFQNAEGLKKNVTPLEYKGIQLGKVTRISINKDLKSVDVNILVNSDAAAYVANTNSRFWINRPRVTLTKVSGLNTLISGYKIELSPKKLVKEEELDNFEEQLRFVGLDTKPDDDLSGRGYYATLIVNDEVNLDVGAPIFYNNFQIGEVISKDLIEDELLVKAYIFDNYKHLVNKSSKFVLNEALKVNYGAAGLSVELGSVYSAIVGGVTVVTQDKNAELIKPGERYVLYSGQEEVKNKQVFNLTIKELDGIDKGTSILYKGIKVGEISKINLQKEDLLINAYLYEEYKYLLTENTQFLIQKPEVSLQNVKNLGNIIKGNYLSLIYKEGVFADSFKILTKDEFGISKDDIILSLYTKNLNSIRKTSKVYYKNIEVGRVIDYALTQDLDKIKIDVAISSQYKDILNDHILFYDMSSKLVQLKSLNLDINFSGIEPLLNGAIGIVGEKRTEKLKQREFKLYPSYKDVEKLKQIYNKGFELNASFNNDFELTPNTAIVYKNQEIGFVKQVKFNDSRSSVTLVIYNKFKKYINKRSRFYKKGAVKFQATLGGILFEADNFTSLVEGALHLDTKSPISYKTPKIFASFDDMQKSSNSVTITFDDVEGLQTEFSFLTYKGVKIGKVTDIGLNSKNKVVVKAIIFDHYAKFARQGTAFYLKKPEISLEKVENLNANMLPVNIGVLKGSGKFKNKFVGYDSFDLITRSQRGIIFNVEDRLASNIGANSPIYYKNIQIGKVLKADLKRDGSSTMLSCLIFDKYRHLVRTNSKFYDISGLNVNVSVFGGIDVQANTMASLLKGGIMVVTPYKYKGRASTKTKFILHKDLDKNWKEISPSIGF